MLDPPKYMETAQILIYGTVCNFGIHHTKRGSIKAVSDSNLQHWLESIVPGIHIFFADFSKKLSVEFSG
jgi:hypothetical protein